MNKRILGLKFRTWLTIIIIVLITINGLIVVTYAKARMAQYEALGVAETYARVEYPINNPTPEQTKIIEEINRVFGSQAKNAFKILARENHSLNPNATNYNADGSIDTGIFQVNSVHGVPSSYLKDWRINIAVAYQIYLHSGWGAWTAESYYHVLDK